MTKAAEIVPQGGWALAQQERGLSRRHDTLSIEELVEQVALIQKAMKSVMKEATEKEPDGHYGQIPGVKKKVLLKAGAEKLCLLFRLDPQYESVETRDGEHLTVKSKCTLYHISTQDRLGSGEGSCSTKETKYAYRSGSRLCPSCGAETIFKSKHPPRSRPHDKPGWFCWASKGGCGAEFPHNDPKIVDQNTDRKPNPDLPDTYNCVTPETRLLTHDLRWVRAGDVQTGDMLIGVEEEMSSQYARHLAVGEAKVYGTAKDVVYEISFEDGRSVRCNGEHRWLVRKKGRKGTEWVSTQDIYQEWSFGSRGRPRNWAVMSLCSPWHEDASKEAGYLSGLLDADGSLGAKQAVVMFAQQSNGVLDRMEAGLAARGFSVGKSDCKTPDELARCTSKKQVYGLRIRGGIAEQMRALGSLRPPRLLDRWLTLIDLSKRRLEGRGSGAGMPERIANVKMLGEQEIVLLGTSCGTYIAEGLVSHNTVLKMANKRALIAAVLNVTAASDIFTQDVDDLPPPPPRPDQHTKTFTREELDAAAARQAAKDAAPRKQEPPQEDPPEAGFPEEPGSNPDQPYGAPLTQEQLTILHAKFAEKAKRLGVTREQVKATVLASFNVTSSKELGATVWSSVLTYILRLKTADLVKPPCAECSSNGQDECSIHAGGAQPPAA